ncbi:MAG: glycosyltransferase family 4 protein [Candidatus Omnitrophica bacterium]|nr:glycosyltransferase family 4 protein [Candidatus Omnitrophota bacterium]
MLLNYEFPPLGGGAGNALYYLLKEFSKYPGLQLHVITSSTDKHKEENFAENIKITFLDIAKKNKNLHYQSYKDLLTYASKSYFLCKQLLKTNHYDLCHAFFGVPCGYVARKLNIPYLVSLRGSDVPFYNQRFYWLDRLFFCRLNRKIWKEAARVIANSQGLKELALKNSPTQEIDVIHNGVDTDQFKPSSGDHATLRVLCISRLIQRKGIEYLMRAVARLPQGKVHLKIVGKGNQEKSLKRLASSLGIASNVEFKEYISHDRIHETYQDSDVFVLPSLNEGMSNAVLEAMACGLPIVTTDTGGTSELLGGNGMIIAKKDAVSIAQALQKFLNDKALITKLGNRSRELALKMSWKNAAKSYYQTYRSITAAPG